MWHRKTIVPISKKHTKTFSILLSAVIDESLMFDTTLQHNITISVADCKIIAKYPKKITNDNTQDRT